MARVDLLMQFQVGTYNSTGKRYSRHFSVWIINELQELQEFLKDMLVNPQKINGWINGNYYTKSDEVAGILPIPADVRMGSGMLEYVPSVDQRKNCPHGFLAIKQGVKKAALPIHNTTERDLFRKLMQENLLFSSRNGTVPNWKVAVKVWNSIANERIDISYKVRYRGQTPNNLGMTLFFVAS